MKICPKCQTPNQDKNYYCVECNAVLTGAKRVDDAAVVGEKLQKADKAERSRKMLFIGIFVVITVLIDAFMIYCGLTIHTDDGAFDMSKIWLRMLWYIPIAFAALFNFDSVYCKIRAKRGLPEKHLPDTVNTAIVGLAIACWFFLQCGIIGVVMFAR